MHSTMLFNISSFGYVFCLSLFAVHLVKARTTLLRLGMFLVSAAFLVQTLGLVARWFEAGKLEVLAAEKALGIKLTGWSWFVVFTQHPPWSNLYEIMVYMSWGVVLVTLACELTWQLAWVRQMGIILALMALGVASLTDASIKPLVPALKSWWIMIHVISASVAYASGSLAAFICLCALIKDTARVRRGRLFGFSLLFLGGLLFCIAGGPRLFFDGNFYVKLMGAAGEGAVSVIDLAKDKSSSILMPMPWMGSLCIVAIVLHLIFGISLAFTGISGKIVKLLYSLAFSSVFLVLAVMTYHCAVHTSIVPNLNNMSHLAPTGPYFVTFRSCPWSYALINLVVIIEALFLIFLYVPQAISRIAPVEVLEERAQKAISLSFFLMAVVLVTGALWAHYAWGRYWAWDPKETGALLIWITYAIYLHTRRTAGLSGPFSSVIGVVGFFIIIIGFLGVNLGLFADGLHTYGNS